MVKILLDEQFIKELLAQIDKAEKEILGIVFFARVYINRKNDEVMQIIKHLADARKRNVLVRVLINKTIRHGVDTKANITFFELLKQNNIEAKITDTRRITHAKLWLFDEKIFITGSHNLSNSSFHRNREISILAEDPAYTKNLKEYFYNNFYEVKML